MTSDSSLFSHCTTTPSSFYIYTADGTALPVNKLGSITSASSLPVDKVYHVPRLS